MFAKLKRELDRVSTSTFEADAIVDHSINCCLTAWHMVDWVWQLHFRHDLGAQTQLAQRAGVNRPPSAKSGASIPNWFKAAMVALCGELKDCEDIAVGAKHVYPELIAVKTVDVHVSARTPQPFVLGVSTLDGGDVLAANNGSVPDKTQYIPKIDRADGTTVSAIQVMDAAVLFWEQFLRNFGIK